MVITPPACFLVPIHPPKFEYGLAFVQSYNQYYKDSNIFLVFSSEDDAEEFQKLAQGLRYRSIVHYKVKTSCPVTEKKYYGLQFIFNFTEFENVGVVDIDSVFTRTVDYPRLFEEYNQRGVFWGNNYDWAPTPIIASPLKFFPQEDQKKLTEILQDCRVYFWFNDLPVYNKKYFLDFIKYIDYNRRYKELVWFDFDYNIYAYYLLVKGLFTVKPFMIDPVTPLNNIFLEDQYIIPKDVFSRLFAEAQPMWIKQDIEPEYMTNTFMNIHLDRKQQ